MQQTCSQHDIPLPLVVEASTESPKSRIYSPTENVADAIAEYINTQAAKEI
jgi:hypothetical protein